VLNGEASSLEKEELHILLQQDESLQQQYDLLVRIWKEKQDDINEEDNINASSIISRIMSRATDESVDADMVSRRKRRRRRLVTYLALSSFAVITAAILFYQQRDNSRLIEQTKPEAIVTQKGSRSHILLADGTTVWLECRFKIALQQ
jgi:ferric-dicitrate binding protein FerR (iron transport regulator)